MSLEVKRQEGDGSSDPNPNPNPCPICLGFITQDAYLDNCFHRYCYQCIVRWTEVVSSQSSYSSRKPTSVKCPLCKIENFSIIYGYDGNTFQRHFINQNNSNSGFFTKTHKYRLQCYYTAHGLLNDKFNAAHYWKTCKYLQRNVWFEKWLRRELQALTQEEDVDIIMHHIHGVIESFSRRSVGHLDAKTSQRLVANYEEYSWQTQLPCVQWHQPNWHPEVTNEFTCNCFRRDCKSSTYTPQQNQKEFRTIVGDAARPFLMARTERFVTEVELFLASGLTVEAYDEAYKRCLGWQKPKEVTEITSSGHEPITPCLHFFDDDSEEADWAEDVHV